MTRKPPPDPYAPPPCGSADAMAVKALNAGTATPEQQQRALKWIVEICAATYDQSYRPGPEGERDTVFAEGKRFVGTQIVKIINTPLGTLKQLLGIDNGTRTSSAPIGRSRPRTSRSGPDNAGSEREPTEQPG